MHESRPFPSFSEIAGALFAALPLMLQASSSSLRTENGRVVEFVYRDWLSVSCGVAAAILGIVTLAKVTRTAPARRFARLVVGLVLVGAGTFFALRGFGIVGIDRPQTTSSLSRTQTAPAAKPIEIDAVALSQHLFDLWRADKLDQLIAEYNWQDVRPQVRRMFELHDAQLGKFVAIVDAKVVESSAKHMRIVGHARFEKATAMFQLAADLGGRPKYGFDLKLPDELLAKLDAAATPEAAERAGRELLAHLLAGEVDAALASFDFELIEESGPDFAAKLKHVVDQIGRAPKVTLRKQEACATKQCIDYELRTSRGTSTASLRLEHRLGRWFLVQLDITAA